MTDTPTGIGELVKRLRATPLYYSYGEQSDLPEQLADALEAAERELRAIADLDVIEIALDPDWPRRIAGIWLARHAHGQRSEAPPGCVCGFPYSPQHASDCPHATGTRKGVDDGKD